MNDIERLGAAHITAAPFISCLVGSREATQALVKYTALIEHLSNIRAQTLRRAESRAARPCARRPAYAVLRDSAQQRHVLRP